MRGLDGLSDPRRRAAIVAAAAAQIGPGDVPAYMVSCGLPASTKVDWCGIFCLAMLHEAGVALDVKWIPGLGFLEVQHLTRTKAPQPGDVFYKAHNQHHGLVESFDPVTGRLTSIEGNTPSVQRLVHDHPTEVTYYSIEKFLGAFYQATQQTAPAPKQSPLVGNLLRGIDVSHHQDPARLDYERLAETHKFVIARATYGTKPDELCAEHVRRARDAGLVTGLYHFFRPRELVVEQLDAFLTVAGEVGCGPGWLPPAVDVEQDPGSLATTDTYAPAEHLTALFREHYGAAMVYVAVGFWGQIGHPEWVKEHLTWCAHWGVQHPTTPFGMEWAIWQHLVGPLPDVSPGQLDQDVARALPLLKSHDPAAPLLLAVDWGELRAERDAEVQETT